MKETIEEGAYVLLTVKYGLIRLISTKADLCEQIGNVDLKCPLESGHMDITKKVDIPAEVPPVSASRVILMLHMDTNAHCRENTPFWLMSTPPTMFRSLASPLPSLSHAAASSRARSCNQLAL